MLNLKDCILLAGVAALTWAAFSAKKRFHNRILEKGGIGGLDRFSSEILDKVFSILLFLISGMLILQILGLDIVPLLTFSGIGAAAIGFASRDVFANFFGGSMIYITRPFTAGEIIDLPGKKIAGTVEEIGWYSTSIRDSQKKIIFVPNCIFSTEFVVNQSRITHRKINEKVCIKNVDAARAQKLIEEIRNIVKRAPDIDLSDPIDVFILSIGADGIEVEIKASVLVREYERFMEIQQGILIQIYKVVF